ncbi:MAG: SUMF1/EgtB/PvdO family nonheme iron enzyme [Candidatus Promineifilaceae bacterium]
MPLISGEILVQRYRIVSLLGQGSAGATYRAWDVKARRDVAIKEILDTSAETQRLFRAEAQALGRLNHAQLPVVLDYFSVENVGQYLVTVFIDGVDCQTLIDQYGGLTSKQIVEWLQSVCKPLIYLHEQKQFHLDIKPANIRITPAGELYLVDSGLAGMGVATGTSGYAAPEQQAQRRVSTQTDIYALGATLHAMATGRTPPDALKVETGMLDLKPAREVNPNLEPFLSIVAGRAMYMLPAGRYQTVADFQRALERPIGMPKPAPATDALMKRLTPRGPTRAPLGGRKFLNPPRRRQMQQRTIWALTAILLVLLLIGGAAGVLTFRWGAGADEELSAETTPTIPSQVALALTDVAPPPSLEPTIPPTPTPTPEPIQDEQTGADMIYVAGGTYRMGNQDGETDEQPVHRVRLDPYFMDATEVTNGAYSLCVEAGACAPPLSPNATYHSAYYGDPDYDDYPVIFVDWEQSQQFCEWRGGRLPTEAEWEFAAGFKATIAQKLKFPWGDVMNEPNANFCDTNCTDARRNVEFDDEHRDTAPVASYPEGRSPLGLYDMAGNVMEWVFDWYSPKYYEISSDVNPMGPLEGEAKVLRGGSWFSDAEDLEVTSRGLFVPAVARANLGFRCAMAVE